jgi:hypothetical protein
MENKGSETVARTVQRPCNTDRFDRAFGTELLFPFVSKYMQ